MIMKPGLSSGEGADKGLSTWDETSHAKANDERPSYKKPQSPIRSPGKPKSPRFAPEHHFYSLEGAEETACLIQHEAGLFTGAKSGPEESLLLGETIFPTSVSTKKEKEKAEEESSLVSFTRLILICFAQIGSSAISVTYLSILLPQEVLQMVGTNNKGSVLGGLSAAGGILSIIGPPLVGHFSDRHTGRFGRRKPYMAAGLVISTAGLIIGGATASKVSMAASVMVYFVVTIGGLVHCTAFNATIPEFPPEQFGTVSGVIGALTVIGFSVGAALGAASSSMGDASTYYSLAGVVFVTGVITLLVYQEVPVGKLHGQQDDEDEKNEAEDRDVAVSSTEKEVEGEVEVKQSEGVWTKTKEGVSGMFSPLKDHDFRWVFLTRLLVQFGVFTVQEFTLYWVQDVLPLEGLSVATRTAILFIPVFVAAFISSLAIGKVSDDLGGERKLFLIVSSFVMGVMCFLMAFVRNYYLALCLMLFFGSAMGSFLALDYALVCDVLPDNDNVARDLGVWHISIVLPQLLAAPASGGILDALQRVGIANDMPFLGYTIIFILSSIYFVVAGGCFFCLRNVK